jgi:hypothetical protein
MIYSKFGTALSLVSKSVDAAGRVRVQAAVEGAAELHEYEVADLKADDGLAEINAAVAALPVRVLGERKLRRRQPL